MFAVFLFIPFSKTIEKARVKFDSEWKENTSIWGGLHPTGWDCTSKFTHTSTFLICENCPLFFATAWCYLETAASAVQFEATKDNDAWVWPCMTLFDTATKMRMVTAATPKPKCTLVHMPPKLQSQQSFTPFSPEGMWTAPEFVHRLDVRHRTNTRCFTCSYDIRYWMSAQHEFNNAVKYQVEFFVVCRDAVSWITVPKVHIFCCCCTRTKNFVQHQTSCSQSLLLQKTLDLLEFNNWEFIPG